MTTATAQGRIEGGISWVDYDGSGYEDNGDDHY